MGLFKKASDIVKANLLDLLESAEDPEKMIKYFLEEGRAHLSDSTVAVHTAITSEKVLEGELNKAKESVALWTKRAELAVKANDDNSATMAITEKQKQEAVVAKLSASVAMAQSQVAKARADLHELEMKLHDAETNQHILIARAEAAKARKATADALGKIGTSSALGALDSMSAKVDHMEAEADASAELAGSAVDETEARFRALETAPVADELAAMKKRLGVAAPPAAPAQP